MRIVIVRHGETDLNAKRILQSADTPLNERGLSQAQHAAEHLGGRSVTKILSSDMTRTKQTAQAIYSKLVQNGNKAVEVVESHLLRERNFGDLQGLTYAEAARIHGAQLFADGDHKSPPNGESMPQFHERTKLAWDWIMSHAHSAADEIIVVTHGLFIYSLATKIFNVSKSLIEPGFGNTSVTIVTRAAPHDVEQLNSTSHLPDHLAKL